MGEGGSEAVQRISKNSSILERTGFPEQNEEPEEYKENVEDYYGRAGRGACSPTKKTLALILSSCCSIIGQM